MKGTVSTFILSLVLFAACKTGSKATVEDIVKAQRDIMPSDSIIQKQKKGIDLFAMGNDPVPWSIEIDFDKMISFSSSDGNKFDVLPAFEKKQITAASEIYNIRTDLGSVSIEIFNTACAGTTEQTGRKATVNIKNKLYTGCGKYLYDHRLNDIWSLESINNIDQLAADYQKGLPGMEFNLQANKMTGSDGCNNISSDIEVKGNRIKFSTFTSTRMACNNNKAAKIFSEMLSNKQVDYFLENGKLVLYLQDDSKLIFKRKQL